MPSHQTTFDDATAEHDTLSEESYCGAPATRQTPSEVVAVQTSRRTRLCGLDAEVRVGVLGP